MNTKWYASYMEVISAHLILYYTFGVLDGFGVVYLI